MNISCEEYLCKNNVHNLSNWRNRMLELRKTRGVKFEQDPDYVKTSQCKDNIIDEKICDFRFNKTNKNRPSQKQHTQKKRESSNKTSNENYEKQYKIYVKELEEYNKNVALGKEKSDELVTINKNIIKLNDEINSVIQQLRENVKLFNENMQKRTNIFDEKMKLQKGFIKQLWNHTKLKKIKKQLDEARDERLELMKARFELDNNREKLEKEIEKEIVRKRDIMEELENIMNKLKYKPEPPKKPKSPEPPKKPYPENSPNSFEYDIHNRCPNGYNRNKVTKKCQKKK